MYDNDYELLYLAKENNEEIIQILFNKYKKIIYTKAKKYSKNSNLDDLYNIAKLSFYRAIDNYRDDNPFATYLNVCLESSLSNQYKQTNTKKNKILNEAISIDDENNQILNIFYDEKQNPETIYFEDYNYQKLKNKIIKRLTWKEELIFKLRIENYSVKEISEIIDYRLQTVYSILKRIQTKISKLV